MRSHHAFAFIILLTSMVSAQTTLLTLTGSGPTDEFGSSVAAAGDFDHDGFPDVIVGAPQTYVGPGYATVFSGRNGQVLATWTGDSLGDRFGAAVHAAGDVNADGYADVIVGAPEAHVGYGGFPSWGVGYARVYAGPNGALLYEVSGSSLTSGLSGFEPSGFGGMVSGGVDVNADGRDDFFVGKPGFMVNGCPIVGGCSVFESGAVQVYSGSNGVLLRAHSVGGNAFFGGVAALGDTNGDGRDDYVTFQYGSPAYDDYCSIFCPTYPYRESRINIVSGASGSTLHTQPGLPVRSMSVAPAGDVDGDGHADVLSSAMVQVSPTSSAYTWLTGVQSGFSGAYIHILTEPGTAAHLILGSVGDVNQDGADDFIMGTMPTAGGFAAGGLRVRSGSDAATLYSYPGIFAQSAAGVGDLTGDGIQELAVGRANQVEIYSMAPVAGATVVNLGSACLTTASPQLGVTAPILGQAVTLTVSAAPASSAGLLLAGAPAASPVNVPGGPAYQDLCPIYVDFVGILPLLPIATDPLGGFSASVALPTTPALQGVSVALQAAIWPSSGGFVASQGVLVTLGY